MKSLQEVTSQEESFMPGISGYIRERVNGEAYNIKYSYLMIFMSLGWSVCQD